MFCKSCGNKIDDDSQFCSYCGLKLSKTNNLTSNNIEQKESQTDNLKIYFDIKNNPNPNNYLDNVINKSKYDSTYIKETEATLVGIIFLVLSLFLLIFPIEFTNIESYNQFKAISTITSLILRILISIWIVNIAKRQNRKTFNWGLFALIFPSVSLIIIGLLKKIKYHVKINTSSTPLENFHILTKEAETFIKDNRDKEAELIYQHIYENFEKNDSIIFKLAELYFKNEKYNESEELLKLIVNSDKYSNASNYYLGFISMKKGNIIKALQHLEISSNNNFLKSTILKNIILEEKIQKIDFNTQKKDFGIIESLNNNQIDIEIEDLSYFNLSFNHSQITLEIFENYLVVNFYKSLLSNKKESFIINYRMINKFERIENSKYLFIFNNDKFLNFEINKPLDISKEYEKKITEKILYFKSNYR